MSEISKAVTRATFRTVLPRLLGGTAAAWKALPPSVKTTAVTAAAGTAGVVISSNLASSDPDKAAGDLLAELTNKDVPTNVDALGALLSVLPEDVRDNALKQAATSQESAVVAQAVAMAAARHSSSRATGDHESRPYAAAAAYDEMVAHMRMIRAAMGALGLGDPAALRVIRDVMFMDEQAFAAALERI